MAVLVVNGLQFLLRRLRDHLVQLVDQREKFFSLVARVVHQGVVLRRDGLGDESAVKILPRICRSGGGSRGAQQKPSWKHSLWQTGTPSESVPGHIERALARKPED